MRSGCIVGRNTGCKSFTGVLTYRNGDLALSSTESELEVMLEGVKEVVWTSRLLREIGLSGNMTKELKCDNLNAVRLTNGGNFKTKSKLINRKGHFIREAVKSECIRVNHVSNTDMTADCLTKPLSAQTLLKHVRMFMRVEDR